jgi:hypothetical protein
LKLICLVFLAALLSACGGGSGDPLAIVQPTQPASTPVTVSAPVISPTQPWEGDNIEDGSTLKVGATFYHFYCAGTWPGGPLDIGFATATESGFPYKWTKYSGNPIIHASDIYSGNGKAVCAPRVISMPDGTYRMYVHAFDGIHDRGFLLTSVHFPESWQIANNGDPIFSEGSGWDGVQIQTQSVIPPWESPDGLYHLFYAGYDGWSFLGGHATSVDGISDWQRDAANPIMHQGGTGWPSHGVVPLGYFKKDGVFYIVAQGFDGHTWMLGYYTSTDLTTFTPSAEALLNGSPGQWNESVEGANAIVVGSDVWVFYVGSSATANPSYRVGVVKIKP